VTSTVCLRFVCLCVYLIRQIKAYTQNLARPKRQRLSNAKMQENAVKMRKTQWYPRCQM
jgi:hypothetical protein